MPAGHLPVFLVPINLMDLARHAPSLQTGSTIFGKARLLNAASFDPWLIGKCGKCVQCNSSIRKKHDSGKYLWESLSRSVDLV